MLNSWGWFPQRVVTGMQPVRFRRTDGLVDGGTIDHLNELQASRRALYDHLDPDWRSL